MTIRIDTEPRSLLVEKTPITVNQYQNALQSMIIQPSTIQQLINLTPIPGDLIPKPTCLILNPVPDAYQLML